MTTTAAVHELVEWLPLLFDRVGGTNTFYQLCDDMDSARTFAEGIRNKHKDIVGSLITVEQRNNKVYITIVSE